MVYENLFWNKTLRKAWVRSVSCFAESKGMRGVFDRIVRAHGCESRDWREQKFDPFQFFGMHKEPRAIGEVAGQ